MRSTVEQNEDSPGGSSMRQHWRGGTTRIPPDEHKKSASNETLLKWSERRDLMRSTVEQSEDSPGGSSMRQHWRGGTTRNPSRRA